MQGNRVRDAEWIRETLDAMTAAIMEMSSEDEVILAGIRTRGPLLAKRLAELVENKSGKRAVVGAVDIRLQRDDFHLRGAVPGRGGTELPCAIDDREVFLVDDVIFTGRTVRAALNELLDHGRASKVRLVALIDRGGREFPVQPDVAGATLEVPPEKEVAVRLEALDGGEDRVLLL